MTHSLKVTWRSMLFVPANSEKFLQSALKRHADAIQLDLEDACPPDLKRPRANALANLPRPAPMPGSMSSCALTAPGVCCCATSRRAFIRLSKR
ncbi:MAG: aldolase/citrate lyase family protein [Burkholderiaceae bacterium]|nr:aldolase/citrate lyase family protein [Burkholderiaceae bacterium]